MAQSEIARAITTSREYLTEQPDKARSRDSRATAVLGDGLSVRVEGPHGWSLVTDMGAGVGGKGAGPTPGWLLRSAAASWTNTHPSTTRSAAQCRLS